MDKLNLAGIGGFDDHRDEVERGEVLLSSRDYFSLIDGECLDRTVTPPSDSTGSNQLSDDDVEDAFGDDASAVRGRVAHSRSYSVAHRWETSPRQLSRSAASSPRLLSQYAGSSPRLLSQSTASSPRQHFRTSGSTGNMPLLLKKGDLEKIGAEIARGRSGSLSTGCSPREGASAVDSTSPRVLVNHLHGKKDLRRGEPGSLDARDAKADRRERKLHAKERAHAQKRQDIGDLEVHVMSDSERITVELYDVFAEHSNVTLRNLPMTLPLSRAVYVVPCSSTLEEFTTPTPAIKELSKHFGAGMLNAVRDVTTKVCFGEIPLGHSVFFRLDPKQYLLLCCVQHTASVLAGTAADMATATAQPAAARDGAFETAVPLYNALRGAFRDILNFNRYINTPLAPPVYSVMHTCSRSSESSDDEKPRPAVSKTARAPESPIQVRQVPHAALKRVVLCPFPLRSLSRTAYAMAYGNAFKSMQRTSMIPSRYLSMMLQSLSQTGLDASGEEERKKEMRNRLSVLMDRGILTRRGLASVDEALTLFSFFYEAGVSEEKRALALKCFEELLATSAKKRELPFALRRPQLSSCLGMDQKAFQALLTAAQNREVCVTKLVDRESVKVGKQIGKGGSATVSQAVWNGYECAFKEYHECGDVAAFVREASTMSVICHPNLIRILGSSDPDIPRPFLLMELAEHGSLADVLYDSDEEITMRRGLLYAIQTCRAVAYLHNLGIIHRDLKSENVLLAVNYVVKLSDYGTARLVDTSTMTKNIGTTYWMAPEIFQEEPYTTKADIYSLAMLMFEIFTRSIPFSGTATFRIPVMVLKGKRPTIPEALQQHRALVKVIESAWNQKPHKRPSAEKLVQILDELLKRFRA